MILQWLFGRPAASDEVVDPAEAKRRQGAGARLIDVREPSEWAAGHAPGASHVPLRQLPTRLDKLPKDRDLLFICASGSRSRSALSIARRAGFERAFSVGGGMSAWARAGLPVKR